jgi:hypothetical protein
MSNVRDPIDHRTRLRDGASARMTHGQERRSRTENAPVGDDLDRLGADALLSYLTDAAAQSDMRLVIEQRSGECFAESRAPRGLGGEMVVLGANGPTRRRAVLGLARLFSDDR